MHLIHRNRWSTIAALGVAAAVALSAGSSVTRAQQARRIDEAALRNAPATGEDWLSHGMDPGEKRYSPLKQIDATNVTRLSQAWTFDIPGGNNNAPPGGGNQEATLLASNGVLYGITTWSVVFAVDARTGKQIWKWDPEV